MGIIKKRTDFVYIFDVKDGNPNGDPDIWNAPRIDPESLQGLVTDVCLKRKVRNYVQTVRSGESGFNIFIQRGQALESNQRKAYEFKGVDPQKLNLDAIESARQWMCDNFFDVRAFGAVMATTKFNCGQVCGPVQFTFARSIDRILTSEHSITRMAHTTEKDQVAKGPTGTMGHKHTVAYGLYKMHGFINAHYAKDTGFSDLDLELIWESLRNMFEFERSSSRGLMGARNLFVFEHSSALGVAPAHKLFDYVTVTKAANIDIPRSYSDYSVISTDELRSRISTIEGVTVCDKLNP